MNNSCRRHSICRRLFLYTAFSEKRSHGAPVVFSALGREIIPPVCKIAHTGALGDSGGATDLAAAGGVAAVGFRPDRRMGMSAVMLW